MNSRNKIRPGEMTRESLEADLRSLPQPDVPPDLEKRLLSAIPTEVPKGQNPRRVRWRRVGGLVGVAACLSLLVTAWWQIRNSTAQLDRPHEATVNLRGMPTSGPLDDPCKETNICDILPPLPNWQ